MTAAFVLSLPYCRRADVTDDSFHTQWMKTVEDINSVANWKDSQRWQDVKKVYQMTGYVAEWEQLFWKLHLFMESILLLYCYYLLNPSLSYQVTRLACLNALPQNLSFILKVILTYFFVGPALDNACWVGPLRGSLQRKGQYLVSNITYDKNAGKWRERMV